MGSGVLWRFHVFWIKDFLDKNGVPWQKGEKDIRVFLDNSEKITYLEGCPVSFPCLWEMLYLRLLFQGLLVAILYCFVNKEVRQMCSHVKHNLNLISALAAVPSFPFRRDDKLDIIHHQCSCVQPLSGLLYLWKLLLCSCSTLIFCLRNGTDAMLSDYNL